MPYGGNIRRLAVFSFLAVTILAEAVNLNMAGIFSAVIPYGGNVLAVDVFFVIFRR